MEGKTTVFLELWSYITFRSGISIEGLLLLKVQRRFCFFQLVSPESRLLFQNQEEQMMQWNC